MKSKEELKTLKEELEPLNEKLAELSEEELEQVNGGAYTPPKPKPRKQDYIPLILGFHCSNCGNDFTAGFNGDALAISGLPAAAYCPNCHSLVYR